MSQPALQLAGAELAQAEVTLTAEAREAAWLADLAASFCVFGLRITLDDTVVSAADEYQVAPEAAPTPANDTAPRFAFPDLARRGLHLPQWAPTRLMQAIDWVVVILVAELAALWGAGAGLAALSIGQAAGFLMSALCLKAGLWITEAYRVTPSRMKGERTLGGLALGVIAGLIAATVLAPDAQSAAALSTILPFAAMLLAGVHTALALWARAAHAKGMFAETIVLIGATDAAQRMAQRAAKSGEARIVAVVDDRLARAPARVGEAPVGGDLEALLAWEGLPHVDRIVITVTQKAETRVQSIIERLRTTPNRVDLLLDYQTQSVRGRNAERLGGAAVACVSGRPHNHMRAIAKRTQDVILGAGLVVAFALPMLLIAAAVKLDSKGPVLYRQRRHGFNNRIITILKFRTMRHEPDAQLRQVCANDPRITRIGAFLRHTSLDELPQLFNVLKGDMSLVGPRPHAVGMKAADRELNDIVAEYAHRHRVKPGLTGWAQVNGSRGPVETAAALRKRVRYDLEYVSRASLWLDLKILLRTAPILAGDSKAPR